MIEMAKKRQNFVKNQNHIAGLGASLSKSIIMSHIFFKFLRNDLGACSKCHLTPPTAPGLYPSAMRVCVCIHVVRSCTSTTPPLCSTTTMVTCKPVCVCFRIYTNI